MEQNFEKIKSKLSPSSLFVKQLGRKLQHASGAQAAASSFTLFSLFAMKSRKLVTAVLILVVLLGGGLSAYAYESPEVTNGNPLYGLKRTIESIEGSFATNDLAQAEFHLKMALRRVEESKVLASRGIEDTATLAEIDKEAAELWSRFEAIKDPAVQAQVIANFKNGLARHLESVSGNTGSGSVINGKVNGYKNDGQERSDEVNKGEQGDRTERENATKKVKEKLEEKLAKVAERKKELEGDDHENKDDTDDSEVSLNKNENSIKTMNGNRNDEEEDDNAENKNENENTDKNNDGQDRSGEVNKEQQGEKKSTENANPQSNMNVKVEDPDEDKPANANVNPSNDNDRVEEVQKEDEEDDNKSGERDEEERKDSSGSESGEREDD